jgi:hypothetical protein
MEVEKQSDEVLLKKIIDRGLSIVTFLNPPSGRTFFKYHDLLSDVWVSGYGKFNMFSFDYNGYDVYKLFCKKNRCDAIMDQIFSLNEPSELYKYLDKNDLKKILYIDVELLSFLCSDKKIMSEKYEELKNYILKLKEAQQDYTEIIDKLIESIHESITPDQWKDFITSMFKNKSKYLYYKIIKSCEHKLIVECVKSLNSEEKNSFDQYINSIILNSRYDLFNDNTKLFMDYYESNERNTKNLLTMNLMNNNLNAVKNILVVYRDIFFKTKSRILSYITHFVIPEKKEDLRIGIFSPFHFAEYHKNKELFDLLNKYYDITYFKLTYCLSNFIGITGISPYKYKLCNIDNHFVISFEAFGGDHYYYLGNKNGVAYFIFTEIFGVKNASAQLVEFKIPYKLIKHCHIEHLKQTNSSPEYNFLPESKQESSDNHEISKDSIKSVITDKHIKILENHLDDSMVKDFLKESKEDRKVEIKPTVENILKLNERVHEMKYCGKGHNNVTKFLDTVYAHYNDGKIDFIRFKNDAKYLAIFNIDTGVQLYDENSWIKLSYGGGYEYRRYDEEDKKKFGYDKLCESFMKHNNKEILDKYIDYGCGGIYNIPKIGWFKLTDNNVIRGEEIRIPFPMAIETLKIYDNRIECLFKLSKENINLLNYPTNYDMIYRLIITNNNHYFNVY